MPWRSFLVLLSLNLWSCTSPKSTDEHNKIIILEAPAETPNLSVIGSKLSLIYTSETSDTTSLIYAEMEEFELAKSTIIAKGTDWFVNWADFSSLVIDENNPQNMLAHWLQKSASGTYDYNIMISKSHDHGKSWAKPQILHNDDINAEHGFVSLENYDQNYYIASWLDGRNTKTADASKPGSNLPMTLRIGYIHKLDNEIIEFEVDNKVCDCCQTAISVGPNGTLVAYRDRSDQEIRDIVVQFVDSLECKIIFESEDQWKISGCPVNGPALAQHENWNAVAWYSAADSAEVFLAYGKKQEFNKQLKIDIGNPLGRVDLEIYQDKAYLTWLEINEDWAEIYLGIINLLTGDIESRRSLATTSSSRRSGFPIFKIINGYGVLAYTKVINADNTQVQLEKIKL